MKAFPKDFADLLSPRGKRVLSRKDTRACGALARDPFFTAADLIDPACAKAAPKLLAKAFAEVMTQMSHPAPSAFDGGFIAGMEKLPKIGRLLTAPATADTLHRAEACGLTAMLQSASYRAFAQALAGRPLRGPDTLQVFCYRPGDYAGPHTDHHPEAPGRREGYIDTHLTFCTPGVEQLLVYAPEGHLDRVQSIAATGAVTAYRLPFWHYTTPLVARAKAARRWLVLGTFLFDDPIGLSLV